MSDIPAGDWSSCFEWCLSKPNHCTQIWVEVRRNGSGLSWSGCSNIQDTVCPVADKELVEHTDCKVGDTLDINTMIMMGICSR